MYSDDKAAYMLMNTLDDTSIEFYKVTEDSAEKLGSGRDIISFNPNGVLYYNDDNELTFCNWEDNINLTDDVDFTHIPYEYDNSFVYINGELSSFIFWL